jgi:hypothetical protein
VIEKRSPAFFKRLLTFFQKPAAFYIKARLLLNKSPPAFYFSKTHDFGVHFPPSMKRRGQALQGPAGQAID